MKTYSDIATDGGSRIVEQVVEQQLKIEKNLSMVKHIVAIGSGKGGVGKSTLTMQIASALNQHALKVSVLDADFNGPSLARMSGLKNTIFVPNRNGFAVPKTKNGLGVVSFGSIFPEPEFVNFESVSKGESYVWRATKEFSIFGEILASADWGSLDVLLIDLPPGVERTVQFAEFFGARAKFVLITIPSEVSRGVVSRSATALKQTKSPLLGYIENMSGYFCHHCKEIQPLFPESEKTDIGIPFLGKVPFDPALANLCDRGLQMESIIDFPSSKSIQQISEKLWKVLGGKVADKTPHLPSL